MIVYVGVQQTVKCSGSCTDNDLGVQGLLQSVPILQLLTPKVPSEHTWL